ncbi:MAG: hypothetical protein ACQESR_20085 [Planctomycetota bacterium]
MESCPTQAVLPLVGLAAEKIIRDRCSMETGDVTIIAASSDPLAGAGAEREAGPMAACPGAPLKKSRNAPGLPGGGLRSLLYKLVLIPYEPDRECTGDDREAAERVQCALG